MAQYTNAMDLGLGKPAPAHTLTPEAEEAREMVRRHGRAKRLNDELARIVTDHGNPHITPYDGPAPAAAKRLLGKAEALGMTAHLFTSRAGHVVEAIDPKRGVAFRAVWTRGKADGGTWHERADRYEWHEDARPVGVNATTRTALADKRPAGMSSTRLKLVASRAGMPCNITEIEKRVSKL